MKRFSYHMYLEFYISELLTVYLILYNHGRSHAITCQMVSKGLHIKGDCSVEDTVPGNIAYCESKCLKSPLCQAMVTYPSGLPCRVYFCRISINTLENCEYFLKECFNETTTQTSTTSEMQSTGIQLETTESHTETSSETQTSDVTTSSTTTTQIEQTTLEDTSTQYSADPTSSEADTSSETQTSDVTTSSTTTTQIEQTTPEDTSTQYSIALTSSQEDTSSITASTAMWREKSYLRNKISTGKELFHMSPLSIAQCSAICTENNRCLSFFYETTSSSCHGHAFVYFDTSVPGFVNNYGCLYYIRTY